MSTPPDATMIERLRASGIQTRTELRLYNRSISVMCILPAQLIGDNHPEHVARSHQEEREADRRDRPCRPQRRWHRDGTDWTAEQVITIPAEPADPADLPPALRPFAAVPPLVSDIDLAVDDQMLYVSCWGTGELKQYDVSDPAAPREVGSVRLGGIVRRTAHPSAPSERLGCGPHRAGRRCGTAQNGRCGTAGGPGGVGGCRGCVPRG